MKSRYWNSANVSYRLSFTIIIWQWSEICIVEIRIEYCWLEWFRKPWFSYQNGLCIGKRFTLPILNHKHCYPSYYRSPVLMIMLFFWQRACAGNLTTFAMFYYMCRLYRWWPINDEYTYVSMYVCIGQFLVEERTNSCLPYFSGIGQDCQFLGHHINYSPSSCMYSVFFPTSC